MEEVLSIFESKIPSGTMSIEKFAGALTSAGCEEEMIAQAVQSMGIQGADVQINIRDFFMWLWKRPVEIVYADLDSYDPSRFGQVVHIKGFGSKIDFSDAETAALADRFVEFVASELKPDTLVWDGDSFGDDSFTTLVVRLRRRTNAELVMFLRNADKDKDRVNGSWPALCLPTTCFLCASDIKFDELGAIALAKTQSKSVASFGGGVVVKEEFERASKEIMFHLAPAKRRAADGTISDPSALSGFSATNLKFLP
mmetsp:Transcript_114824/g.214932  ORF Transcript_114824/g.214932 Transcript_114824/m.214932 type:complete len:255 (-) Transcript_114824:261-1025(-)